MKKAFALLLAFLMVLSLAACTTDPQNTTSNKNTPTDVPTNKPTTAPTNKPTEPTTAPTEPEVLYAIDDERFAFVVQSAINTEEGFTLEVSIKNKSTSAQSFSVSNVTANDYVCPDIYMNSDVAAGETNTATIFISKDILAVNGVTEPTKVEFALFAMNSETWDELYNAPCTVYPNGEENHVDDGGYAAQEGDTVVVENDSCTIIVTGVDPSNEMGYVVNLYVANKTDKSLLFESNSVTVNDLMFEPYWSVEVPAGKRCISQMIWYGDTFATYGMTEITKIDFAVTAKDPMDWESPDFAGAHCTLYPMGEDAFKPFERPAQDTDIVLMENAYVTVTVTSIGMDADGNFNMVLFIENHADIALFVKPNTVCINGLEKDPYWAATVSAGKATFSTISWYAFSLQESEITAVDSISMIMNVFNSDASETFVTEEITITP